MPPKIADEAPSLAQLADDIRTEEAKIAAGGGGKAIERQHAKGRLTARERIERLIDPDTRFFEIGIWAGWEMYSEWGGAPAAGVICGTGTIAGRRHMIIANDATVKAGAFFPATAKKVLRAQRIAFQNRLPLVYLVDSAGVFLPLQEDVFPDEDDFGRIFRNNAVMSAAGLGQIAAIMGNCVAGGGYLPVLCDKLLMTEGSGLYLAGPALVRSAIGQEVDSEELGGAKMHAQISGTIDYRDPDDPTCLARLRRLVSAVHPDPVTPPAPFARYDPTPPARSRDDIYELVSAICAAITKFARCWTASSTRARSTNTRRSTGSRWCAAPRGWAAFRWASSPTNIIRCGRPRGRSSSAACSTSTAPKKPPGS